MKKLVFSAAALSLTGTAVANDSDWAQLDQDIQALSASVQGLEPNGVTFGGRIRAIYGQSSDISVNGPTGGVQDFGGFNVRNARIYSTGTVTDGVSYRLEVDFGSGDGNALTLGAGPGAVSVNNQIGLLDAYLDIQVGAEITARVGQFRGHILRESLIESGNLFFVERSVPAGVFSGRQAGIAVIGEFDQFEWAVTLQNGGDGQGDELLYAFRGDINLLDSGTKLMEGAYGVGDQSEATVGVSYFSDEAIDDGDGFAVDGSYATRLFSVRAAVVDFGDTAPTANGDQEGGAFLGGAGINLNDATPFSIMGTFMLSEGTTDYGALEIGARFQNLDDVNDTQVYDIGLNYYVNGHNLKYVLNYTNVDGDGNDVDLIQLGVNARF